MSEPHIYAHCSSEPPLFRENLWGLDSDVDVEEENIAFVRDQEDINGEDSIDEMISFYLAKNNKILMNQDHDDTGRRDQVLESHGKQGFFIEKQVAQMLRAGINPAPTIILETV